MQPPHVYLACTRVALLAAMTPISSYQALTNNVAPLSWSPVATTSTSMASMAPWRSS